MHPRRVSEARARTVDRKVVWIGSALRDLKRMPLEVRRLMGTALHWEQTRGSDPGGVRRLGLHPAARKMKGDLSDVVEIRDDLAGEAYRAMYTARLGETIYVRHAFQKKSKRDVATPGRDLALIRARLASAREREEKRAMRRGET